MSGNKMDGMDEERARAGHLRRALARAQEAGHLAPPLTSGARVRCATPGCAYMTSIYLLQQDGTQTALCGACAK